MLINTVLESSSTCNPVSLNSVSVPLSCNIDCNKWSPDTAGSADFVPILGNIGKLSTPSDFEGKETYKRIQKRLYALQRKARQLLPEQKALQSCDLHALPYSWVQGHYVPETQSAYFGGLKHCKSPDCPRCSPGKAEAQKRKLTAAMAEAQKRGYSVYHLVFTLSHSWRDSLADEYEALIGALEGTFEGKWWTKQKKAMGYVGRVRALEDTFGRNGWHLHSHIALFTESPQDVEALQAALFARYADMLAKQGYFADSEHGLKVTEGYSELVDYVTKYGRDPALELDTGIESELTEFRLKEGRNDSLTPFELLAAACGESKPLDKLREVTQGRYSDAQLVTHAAELFVEHFETMKRKPRLYWSKGLEAALDVEAALDWMELENPKPKSVMLYELEPQGGWKDVRDNGGLRAELKAETRTGDVDQVRRWLAKHGVEALLYPDGDMSRSEWVGAAELVATVSGGEIPQVEPIELDFWSMDGWNEVKHVTQEQTPDVTQGYDYRTFAGL